MPDLQKWEVKEVYIPNSPSTKTRAEDSKQPYVKMSCGLGEAPFYEKETHSLRFVDIVQERLHTLDLNRGPSSLQSFDLGAPVRWVNDFGHCSRVEGVNGVSFQHNRGC